MLGPQLEARILEMKTIRLRKIDVGAWDSPVAVAHGIRRLPTLMLYDGTRLVSSDTREIVEHLGL